MRTSRLSCGLPVTFPRYSRLISRFKDSKSDDIELKRQSRADAIFAEHEFNQLQAKQHDTEAIDGDDAPAEEQTQHSKSRNMSLFSARGDIREISTTDHKELDFEGIQHLLRYLNSSRAAEGVEAVLLHPQLCLLAQNLAISALGAAYAVLEDSGAVYSCVAPKQLLTPSETADVVSVMESSIKALPKITMSPLASPEGKSLVNLYDSLGSAVSSVQLSRPVAAQIVSRKGLGAYACNEGWYCEKYRSRRYVYTPQPPVFREETAERESKGTIGGAQVLGSCFEVMTESKWKWVGVGAGKDGRWVICFVA